MPDNVTTITGATPTHIYLGNYAWADIVASMDNLRYKLATDLNRLSYKNAAGGLFKVMTDASTTNNHPTERVLFTDATGAADSSANLTYDGTTLTSAAAIACATLATTGDVTVGLGVNIGDTAVTADGTVKYVDDKFNFRENGAWVTISSPAVSGTGTTNYLTKWSAADTVTDSVAFDDGTNIGMGRITPLEKLDVNGNVKIWNSGTDKQDLYFGDVSSGGYSALLNSNEFEEESTLLIIAQPRESGDSSISIHAGIGFDNNILMLFHGDDGTEYLKYSTDLLYADKENTRVGINRVPTTHLFEVGGSTHVIKGSAVALYVGATAGDLLTDATAKAGQIAVPHYTNAEEPAGLISCISDGTDNSISIGGGSANVNAATSVKIYTAADDTTTTGTERLAVDSAGILTASAYTTNGNLSVDSSGVISAAGGVHYAATTAAVIANTTTETTMIGAGVGSLTLAANYLKAGKVMDIAACGFFSTKSAPVGNVTFNLKMNTVTVSTTGAVVWSNGQTNQYFSLKCCLVCYSVGAGTGVVWIQGGILHSETSPSADWLNSIMVMTSPLTTVDTTAPITVDLTVQWATADAANTITASCYYILAHNDSMI